MLPGPLMLDLVGQSLSLREKELLSHPQVGGIIFFSRNFSSREQIVELAGSIREVRPDILLAVDQEGGRVQRFRDGYTRFPPMAVLGNYLCSNPEDGGRLLRDAGWLLGAEVIASGLDFSFAPVLDVDEDSCKVISDRSFSPDPELATAAASLLIEGLREAGMAVTGKHFPGHGGVAADSHLETPVDSRSFDELAARDLIPFKMLSSRLDAVMPAHILFPKVDSLCVGFSRHWLQDILRGEFGFDGVIFSDDLSMKGADLAGSYPQKAEAALAAGCDMVLVCNEPSGAEQVLAYLESTDPVPSSRLPTMSARRKWTWTELENSERRLFTVERLARL